MNPLKKPKTIKHYPTNLEKKFTSLLSELLGYDTETMLAGYTITNDGVEEKVASEFRPLVCAARVVDR